MPYDNRIVNVLPSLLSARMADVRSVLIAGAGGGYDVVAGLPMYYALRAAGKTVHLANLSFAELRASDALCRGGSLFEITADTRAVQSYFPELALAIWLNRVCDDATPVFAIERSGAKPTIDAYERLNALLGGIDAVILVDGGTDILMRGDESGLGTPLEDMASLIAVAGLSGPSCKVIACIGFGIDAFHGVCHAQFLESVAALARTGGFFGSSMLTAEMPEVVRYLDAVQYLQRTRAAESIVNSSIAAAIRGEFGDQHAMERTRGNNLFINPLMSLLWAFDLNAVAERNLYLESVRRTETLDQLSLEIEAFRSRIQNEIRPWVALPM